MGIKRLKKVKLVHQLSNGQTKMHSGETDQCLFGVKTGKKSKASNHWSVDERQTFNFGTRCILKERCHGVFLVLQLPWFLFLGIEQGSEVMDIRFLGRIVGTR